MSEKKEENYYVVGIGASAGGLEPIQKLFDLIPRFTKAAFVLVQHLSPDFVSLMDELLRRHTEMMVSTAKNNERIIPGRIYLVPRKKFIKIESNRLIITDKDPKSLNMPVDIFFHSLGKSMKEKAIGIILSGSGTDGSRGIRTIIEEGGIVMVQDIQSAQFDGMPRAANNTDLPDFVGNPHEIARQLIRICQGEPLRDNLEEMFTKEKKLPYQSILSQIRQRKNIDFSNYKPGTLTRRIEKRIQILGLSTLAEYSDYIIKNVREMDTLVKELLIGVTKFFRNMEAFVVIEKKVIPLLFKNPADSSPLRIWIMGCSTGEEVYSLAILLNEYKRLHNAKRSFKIFATDVNDIAITKAGLGKYEENIELDIPPDLLSRYFNKTDTTYEVNQFIREKIVFASHNVLRDPPFINMDMIVSRNFLIYIDSRTQKLILDKFHYCLKPNGFLFLGSSESISGKEKDFETIDAKWRVYQSKKKLSGKSIEQVTLKDMQPWWNKTIEHHVKPADTTLISPPESNVDYNKILLEHYIPSACLFVSQNMDVQHVMGTVENFLEFPTTPTEFNLKSMIEKNQVAVFINGVKEALNKNKTYTIRDLPFSKKGKNFKINLKFTPKWIEDSNEKLVLVEFMSTSSASDDEIKTFFSKEEHTQEQIKALELELHDTQKKLKANIEKYEVTNEELHAANEELMSSNEEMQSTNEELQSVNEELYTVNAELNSKIKELTSLNNDIDNLLASTDIGTIFLDKNLTIRKFTPPVKKQFSIANEDIGRPIFHFSNYFGFENFKEDIHEAMLNSKAFQRKIRNDYQKEYLMKINPFITSDQEVKGVVISFIDIEGLGKKESGQEKQEIK